MPEHTDDTPRDGAQTDLPADVAEEAARLTRLVLDTAARDTVAGPFQGDSGRNGLDAGDARGLPTEAAVYRDRRDDLLERFDYVPRVREDRDGGATLVCYPSEWLDENGVVRLEADLDTERAAEIPLSGPGEQGDYETAAAENDELVESVDAVHDERHVANVRSFADFMSNHYARPATTASAAEVREFLNHYYPRNAWPSDEQAEVVEDSLRYAFERRDRPYPLD